MNRTAPASSPPHRRVLPLAIASAAEGDLAAYFEGLANPTRLRIVQRLAEVKESRVSDVALLLGISQPRMSWHLRLLRRARIVKTRRYGREVLCRLDRESIQASFVRFSRLLEEKREPKSDAGSEIKENQSVSQPPSQDVAEGALPEVVR